MTPGQRHYDDAPGSPGGIPELWAWIAVDAMAGEGIVGIVVPGAMVPLVTGDRDTAQGPYRQLVLELAANVGGRRFELRRYSAPEVEDLVQ